MSYQQHDLQQGTEAWHAFRATHYGASEAAAMLGLSKYTSRNELLRQKATGVIPEVDARTQTIFDRGHETEALARPIIEAKIGEQLSPVTLSSGNLSCSCDGLTFDDSVAWEHKQWNKDLAESVARAELPDTHMPQCQQILMITGAEKLIFTVSDGTLENIVSLIVLPNLSWFERIRAGWAQFAVDLENYIHVEHAANPEATPAIGLPALFAQVEGRFNLATNIDLFSRELKQFVGRMDLSPTDDQGFADLEAQVKVCAQAEESIKAQVLGARGQMISFDEFCKTAELLLAIAARARIDGTNAIKEKKVAIKAKAIADGKALFAAHVVGLEVEIAPIRLLVEQPDFLEATKGLKGLKSLHNAIDTALANGKIAADLAAKDVRHKLANMATVSEYAFLFPDLQQFIFKPADDFTLMVTSRIAKHEAEAAEKLEAERARIQAQEEAKAKAAQDALLAAERAKMEAEVKAKAEEESKATVKAKADAMVAQNSAEIDAGGQDGLVRLANRVANPKYSKRFRPTRLEMIMSIADSWDVHKSEAEIWLRDEFSLQPLEMIMCGEKRRQNTRDTQ